MTRSAARHAIIIGGGASGVLLAYQLLQKQGSDFCVTLVEKRPDIGRGLAYHTGNPDHLLNVRAANMSALPDDPDHFWRWLSTRGPDRQHCHDPFCFVPRRLYGDYIASLVEPLLGGACAPRSLSIVQGECTDVGESADGVAVMLADGRQLAGDIAILATGHDPAVLRMACQADPWAPPSAAGIDKDATILILGTGLTAIDYVLTLLADGHRGPVIAMSRRGLMARAHRRVDPVRIDEAEVPFGASASHLLRWFRRRVDAHVAQGGDWRSVVDGIRPFTQRIWRELPLPSRRRFLEHVRAWWDVHRHRMAPEVEMRVTHALSEGRLTSVAAKVTAIEPNARGAFVRYRRRGRPEIESLQVGTIVDCTGIVRDASASPNPVLRSLFDQGLARPDRLRIGLDIATDCAIISRDGVPSRRLFAIGPLTRAAFWEIMAIPDIRNQCADLATQLIRSRRAAGVPSDDQVPAL
ncbi:MAG TPA: FAD/NAD(P)-binding protein [Bradyrhizobium sp.]|nr:FAD/NAD(P)-binding protein [Bradyrhizobium sp.]